MFSSSSTLTKNNCWLVPLFLVSLTACFGGDPKPQLTTLDKQNLQTRQYQVSEKIAFASVVSVLQDLGYIIGNADRDSGLVTAKSPQTTSSSFWLNNVVEENTKVTAFIEEIGQSVRIRLNFLRTRTDKSMIADGLNEVTRDDVIYDANVYRNAFNLIEEAIFLRTPSPPSTPQTPTESNSSIRAPSTPTP